MENKSKLIQKVWGFGAYLQNSYFLHDDVLRKNETKRLPSRKDFREMYSGMSRFKLDFDITYSEESLRSPTHPLAEDKRRWGEISLDMERFLEGLRKYKANYSTRNISEEDKIRGQLYFDIWWMYIQEWNKLSNSVKSKVNF